VSALKKVTIDILSCSETGRRFHADEYPKKCSCCESEFLNRESYWEKTEALDRGDYSRGTKGAVFEYRNCTDCKSTLVIKLINERDDSVAGIEKRVHWNKQFQFLVSNGITVERAKSILNKKKF
jgi:hypothetical protein